MPERSQARFEMLQLSCLADGGWRMADNGKRRTGNGERRTENGERRTIAPYSLVPLAFLYPALGYCV